MLVDPDPGTEISGEGVLLSVYFGDRRVRL